MCELSRQRKWQAAMRKRARCEQCGSKRHPASKSLCIACLRLRSDRKGPQTFEARAKKVKRDARISKMYLGGKSPERIGNIVGLSGQHVISILVESGIPRRRRGRPRKDAND